MCIPYIKIMKLGSNLFNSVQSMNIIYLPTTRGENRKWKKREEEEEEEEFHLTGETIRGEEVVERKK